MTDANTFIILVATLIVIVLVVIIVTFFSIFQNRKIKFISEQEESKRAFNEEIIKSKLETQEQTLQNISWELHDNVGQLLSVAKMQINTIVPEIDEKQRVILRETGDIISKSLQEIRSLSKLMNPEVVKNIGLDEALQLEIDRFNRLNFIEATYLIEGKVREIDQKDEIILFRILQEFLSNSLKHSKTTKLHVGLHYKLDELVIIAEDFGIGFDENTVQNGAGLLNMRSRAKLINTTLSLKTKKEQGVSLTLTYPLN